MKFRKKPVVIDAITFDELVQYGKDNGGNIVNSMPWSFNYNGQPVTHENDDCYLIPTLEGTMKLGREDMLITGVNGEIYPCKKEIFDKTYSPVQEPTPNDLSKAIDELRAELSKDQSEGSYYYGWQSNIAMAFIDACKQLADRQEFIFNPDEVRELANEAAQAFLNTHFVKKHTSDALPKEPA